MSVLIPPFDRALSSKNLFLFKIHWAVLSKGVNLQTTKSNINNFLPQWPSSSVGDFPRIQTACDLTWSSPAFVIEPMPTIGSASLGIQEPVVPIYHSDVESTHLERGYQHIDVVMDFDGSGMGFDQPSAGGLALVV